MPHKKPRKATHKEVNKRLAMFGPVCERWDGGYPECDLPWCGKCQGKIFECQKQLWHHMQAAKKVKREVRLEVEWKERQFKEQLIHNNQ